MISSRLFRKIGSIHLSNHYKKERPRFDAVFQNIKLNN